MNIKHSTWSKILYSGLGLGGLLVAIGFLIDSSNETARVILFSTGIVLAVILALVTVLIEDGYIVLHD